MSINQVNSQRKFIWIRRGLLGLLLILLIVIILLVAGVSYQALAEATDRQGYPPPGQLVDVNGHRMHIYCTGNGSPTIILEAGAYSFSSEWYWVQKQLATTNRVCSYDRAGNGWSAPVAGARDGLTLVHELHSLLAAANISGPYILAGHSLGGLLNRIYATQYPGEVLGMVLVDSAVPITWSDISGYEKYKSQNESAYMIMSGLARVSALRFIISNEFRGYGYPDAMTAQLTAFKSTNRAVDTWDAEVRLAQWELGQQARGAEHLDKLPIIVMWASHPEITTPEDRAKLQAIWDSVPTFSTNNIVRIVKGADHGSIIGNDQYAAQVSSAIRDVMQSAHSGQLLN